MVNAWMQTVKRVRDQMPKGTPLKAILVAAKKVYKKPAGLVKKVAKSLKRTVTGKRRRRRKEAPRLVCFVQVPTGIRLLRFRPVPHDRWIGQSGDRIAPRIARQCSLLKHAGWL